MFTVIIVLCDLRFIKSPSDLRKLEFTWKQASGIFVDVKSAIYRNLKYSLTSHVGKFVASC